MRALAAAERALRCGRREPGPADQLGAFLFSPGTLQKVPASHFNFPGRREERAPLRRAKSLARALCALALRAEFFRGGEERGTAVFP